VEIEQSPTQITHDRYKQIAYRFVPNGLAVVPAAPEKPALLTKKKLIVEKLGKTGIIQASYAFFLSF
jgi:hypothetical protein